MPETKIAQTEAVLVAVDIAKARHEVLTMFQVDHAAAWLF